MEKVSTINISSIWKRVHNALVQYGKRSTIYKFNMEKDPQYISSILIAVLNISVQYGKGSTIYYFMEVSTMH